MCAPSNGGEVEENEQRMRCALFISNCKGCLSAVVTHASHHQRTIAPILYILLIAQASDCPYNNTYLSNTQLAYLTNLNHYFHFLLRRQAEYDQQHPHCHLLVITNSIHHYHHGYSIIFPSKQNNQKKTDKSSNIIQKQTHNHSPLPSRPSPSPDLYILYNSHPSSHTPVPPNSICPYSTLSLSSLLNFFPGVRQSEGLFLPQQYRTMLTRNQSKATKTICLIQTSRPTEYVAPQLDEQAVVTFQTHSQKMDLNKQAESELFGKVLAFLRQFLTTRKLWTEVHERMNKYGNSSERLSSEKKNEKMLSFKKMTFGSRICFDAEAVPKAEGAHEYCNARATRGNNKKISILINEEDFSSSEEMFSDELLSETVVRTIRSIQIPRLEMSLETVEMIYDTPQPFLITLSLCIFTRYCLTTRRKVRLEESAWVLCVATVIAYKLYYDEEIEGLIDCFTGIMKVHRQDLIDLQRCFLEEIDYATVIRNYDYHFIMAKLLSMPIEQRIEEE